MECFRWARTPTCEALLLETVEFMRLTLPLATSTPPLCTRANTNGQASVGGHLARCTRAVE